MLRRTFLFLLALSTIAATARAATVSLDIELNKVAKTYQVFATVNGSSEGLASFDIDVVGAGGATATKATLQAPRVFDNGLGDFTGFSAFRNNGAASGTSWVGIVASQDTTQTDPGYYIFNVGVASPYLPVLLASGTYSGTVGTLTAQLHSGNTFNLFPQGFSPGGSTFAATSVLPSTAALVPEPATVAMLATGIIMLGAAGYRRRARAAA
ncbi:MAG TPA: PEP-CTERM sorting domain-containing protein [Pirellulales bacterium]|jgi:hypothetical protein